MKDEMDELEARAALRELRIHQIELEKQNEELRRARGALEAQLQARQLESLVVLAGGIAHDFNNLLQAIFSHAELALEGLHAGSPVRDDLGAIRRAAERAAELTSQMLAYSGKGKLIVKPLDFSALVSRTVRLLEGSIGEQVELRHELAGELPVVEVDATQIRQVVMNLIINASEAIGEKRGTIRVITNARQCDQSFLRQAYLDDDLPAGYYVSLKVIDTGCGMDEATRAKAFEPFFTTKFSGRGLGLAALLGIVRGHHGAIRLSSEPGRGTTAELLLPASRDAAPPRLPVEPTAQEASSRGTVLVVDDEPTLRIVAEKMLRKLGFEVLTAADGLEGIEVFRRHAEEVRLILIDVKMPRMGAEKALPELRRIKSDVKVVIITGYSEQQVMERFVSEDLDGFLFKPFHKTDLLRMLRKALGTLSP